MADRFDGQVAIVTGAAAGFGLAVASRLAAEGARVVLVDRATEPLAEAAAEISGALPVVADVSQEADVDFYVQAAVAGHGRIDLFFNNAGIEGRLAPMTELSVEDFDRVLAVNCRGVFLGLRAVLRVMKQQNSGAIVNTASMAGIRGSATFAPYVASKHAATAPPTRSPAWRCGCCRPRRPTCPAPPISSTAHSTPDPIAPSPGAIGGPPAQPK